MADEEAEKDRDPKDDVNVVITELKQRLEELQETAASESTDSRVQSSFKYCQDFCRALLEYAGRWRIEDEPLPVVRVYTAALQSFAGTSAHLSVECDNVPLVVDRLARSFVELLLSLKELPDDIWNDFRSCVQVSHGKLQENGISQLSMLWTLGQQTGVWTNPLLQDLLSGEELTATQIETLLVEEGPSLLELRVKQLIKDQELEKAARLAKVCSESASCDGKAHFKQMYLVCLCTNLQQDQLMEELNKVDCQDALEMICNLESDGDEKAAFTLCSAFLTRQLLQTDSYCSWELTLFWSKLLKRLEPSEKAFLDKCAQMSSLSKTVYHILFLIKVIQSEITEGGLPMCIEMCIRALRMQSEDGNTTATVCKTIACLLPNDLEVKRACQLTVFLLEPTVDSYYTVETLYNEPDQKMDEEKMPVPNSLRCELLLVFKTQWSFDPEFWDWKTLKRHCLARMGPEASIVSSIDSLNDTDDPEEEEEMYIDDGFLESADRVVSGTYELTDNMDRKQKNREQKKLREKGFISARFRNWQVYMQYCVLCDKEFLGHRIIRHAQTHFSRGEYSCPICAQSFSSKDTLVPHVTSHVKQSCKDRLTAMKTNRKLANPKTAAPVIAAIMAKTESDISEGGGSLGQNTVCVQTVKAQLLVDRGEDHVCPVGTCKKTFKFYRNLLAHVRSHNENEEAQSYLEMQSKKVVCQYCRRHFINVNHLNDHLQVHCGAKPYICIQLNCKASFLSNTELLVHRKTHSSFKARCLFPNCGKIFSEAFKLYDHEAKHYKTFTCKSADCGKVFHTQQQLDLHSKCHVKKEPDVSAPDEHLQPPQTSSFNMAPSIPDQPPLKESHLQPSQTSSYNMAPSIPGPQPSQASSYNTAPSIPGPQPSQASSYNMAPSMPDPQPSQASSYNMAPSMPEPQPSQASSFNMAHSIPGPQPSQASSYNMAPSMPGPQPSQASSYNMAPSMPGPQPSQASSYNMAPSMPGPQPSQASSYNMAPSMPGPQPSQASSYNMAPSMPGPQPSQASSYNMAPSMPEPQPSQASSYNMAHSIPAPQPSQASSYNMAHRIPGPQHSQASSFNMAHRIPGPQPLKEADNSTENCRAETVSVGKPETLENLLKASQTPIKTVDRYEIKAEQTECFHSEANQIVNVQIHLQPENRCCRKEDSQSQLPDLLNPSHQYKKQHASPFEATLNKMLREKSMLQSQIHTFSSNVKNNDIVNYSDVPLCTAARPTLPPTQPVPAPLAVKLPAVPPGVATPSVKQEFARMEAVLRERYHCPFENCTRNYSCFKSVSKHIKTSHPDKYAIRKIPRSEIRVTYVHGPPLVPKPVVVKTQDNQNLERVRPQIIQPTPYTNMAANYNAVKPPVTVNQTGPQIMENVLNPIVVAQLKNSFSPQTCSHMQKSLPNVPKNEQVQNFSTSITNLPRQPEFTASNPAITVTNSIPSSHLPPCSRIKTQDVRTVWSSTPQTQQLSNNSAHLHPTRLSTPISMPMLANNRTSISANPNNILVNSLTNAQKDMQSSAQHLYRPTAANTALLPKVQIKTEGQNLSLWSPASELKHGQSGNPSPMPTNRSVVAANTPVPLKDPSGSLLGSNRSITPTSIAHCSSRPHYTPPFGQSNLSQTGHQMSRQIQKTQIATVKPSQILPKVMDNSNAPIHTKCSHFSPVQSNIATHIPATSLPMSTKPLVPANIKIEENCDVSSFTMQREPTENTNKYTNTVQNPSSQPGNLGTPENDLANCKPVKKRNKVRWPAIVRDGKWFCSRCYRAFSSSKSLGGHLSKRTACIPYNELELNADLPASFLDLLNSDQAVNRQQNFPNNPCQTVKNRPHSSKSLKLLEQKGCTPQKCQEKLNGETSNDILKQIMTASNMEDLFAPSHMPQLQKPCISSGTAFQRSSVKQFIDAAGRDVDSSKIPNCPQSRPPGSRYPTPLLSQALKNNKSASVQASSSPQELHSKDQASERNIVPPFVHQKSPTANNIKQPERGSYEQDVKKKLREQILAGDFQRRSNLANVCHNSEAQSPMSCSSESSSKNEDCQMKWDAKGANVECPAIIPGTPAEIEELLKTKSFTCLRQKLNPEQDTQSSTSIALSQDVDYEPQQLSPSQQWCFSELKIAFEKLNLIKDSPEPVPEPVTVNMGLDGSSTSSEMTLDDSLAMPKIFACEADNCAYNTFSSEAYWRHLYKVHNYTFEQVNAVKKTYGQYAPFQCQRCTKKFTRNPNLKSHYISAHQLSFEEVNELDLKRKKDRAAMTRLITMQNGGAKKRRLPTPVHQELLYQTHSNPGGTTVIQALPNTSKDPQRTAANVAHLPQTDVPAKGPLSPDKQLSRPAAMKPCNDLMKKTDKKSTSSDVLSQYKPYRCVHQDCEAAFAIQHNLILHYRAVHQSALSALEVNKEQDQMDTDGDVEQQEEEEEEPPVSEFRCQVKDCSRVFQQVPQLMQHYLRLHEFSIDKVGDLLSVIRLGRFACGHEGCAVSFTAFWKYIAHVKELHKDVKLSKPENMYKCEIEGCDRAYATKSNMLRHLMKKHNDFYQLKQKNLPKPEDGVKQNAKKEYQLNKTSNGKENIERNQTKDNNAKRTRKINNYWTRYEKPVLKSNVEASAMCTKSYPLQYPCMIKGCESVMNSEKSILKHYTVHGLSEKFLEQHRSHYIFCKKFPRQKNGSVRSDDSKSDQSSDSEAELTGLNGADFDDSKPFLRKRTSPGIHAALLDGLSNEESSDGSVVLKRKRGRPKRIVEKIIKRKKMSHPPKACESRDECSDSSVPLSEKDLDQSMSLAAFKPMGFEMSFLKFLEQSNKPQPSLSCEIPLIGPWVRLSQLNTKETCVKFSNRQNLKSLDKVKIIVDKTFLGATEIMLKQLQDMHPMVILEKK
ncbi:zinc finger protein 292b [Eucyclogobius newberryi]|uniref:zinc finger protein 292b n=1 Tax=Eucyclogobius newberryi TaxID=166745 RepID=UPI003B59FFDB